MTNRSEVRSSSATEALSIIFVKICSKKEEKKIECSQTLKS